jgi:hypothetical protein
VIVAATEESPGALSAFIGVLARHRVYAREQAHAQGRARDE